MTPAVLTGLAIGDALGMPFEKPADQIDPRLATWDVTYLAGEWTNRMTHNLLGDSPMNYLPPGHWTDDTEMATALAESLVRRSGYDVQDVAKSYLAWARSTPHGMGTATMKAMRKLADGVPWDRAGTEFATPEAVGNGTAMRCAPIGAYFSQPGPSGLATMRDCMITHRHHEALAAASMVVCLVAVARGGLPLLDIARMWLRNNGTIMKPTKVSGALEAVCEYIENGVDAAVVFERIGRRGNAIQTTSTAIFCAMKHEDDFVAGVREAICGGGDTDTRGAIAGAILAARVGLEGIPEELVKGVKDSEKLLALDALLAMGNAGAHA